MTLAFVGKVGFLSAKYLGPFAGFYVMNRCDLTRVCCDSRVNQERVDEGRVREVIHAILVRILNNETIRSTARSRHYLSLDQSAKSSDAQEVNVQEVVRRQFHVLFQDFVPTSIMLLDVEEKNSLICRLVVNSHIGERALQAFPWLVAHAAFHFFHEKNTRVIFNEFLVYIATVLVSKQILHWDYPSLIMTSFLMLFCTRVISTMQVKKEADDFASHFCTDDERRAAADFFSEKTNKEVSWGFPGFVEMFTTPDNKGRIQRIEKLLALAPPRQGTAHSHES
jgi:hypothetical protein